MKGSGRAAPNDRDKGRYGANRQVRASANARKWKRMIEYVTISLLVLAALVFGWCLGCLRRQTARFGDLQPKRWVCQNWTAHHQLCIPLHAGVCLTNTYMCFVDEFLRGCDWPASLEWGGRIGGEGVAGGAGRPSHRIPGDSNGGGGLGGSRQWGRTAKVTRGPPQHACGGSSDPPKAATGTRRVASAGAAAAAATAAARPAAGRRHEERPLRARRHRERAQGRTRAVCAQWRRAGRVQPPVLPLGPERRPGPPPSAPAAGRCGGRILVAARRHSQGSEGWVRRWSRAKEGGRERRRRPPRPLRPDAGIRPRCRTRLDPAVRRP